MERCRVTEELNAHERYQDYLDSDPILIAQRQREREEKMDCVIEMADSLLTGITVYAGGKSYTIDDVLDSLLNHDLYEPAMDKFVLGIEDPLRDLKLRAAREVAALALGTDLETLEEDED